MKRMRRKNRLLVSIVDHGFARKAEKASKEAGATGGTTIMGKSLGDVDGGGFFGIPIEKEREVLLTLTSEERLGSIMEAVVSRVNLEKPGRGMAFVVDLERVLGIYHQGLIESAPESVDGGVEMEEEREPYCDLIVTIVNKGDAEKVVSSAKQAGAEGGTVLNGRGTGIHEYAKLFGITIEPEKEIILTLIEHTRTDAVLRAIVDEVELSKPGKGIAFTLSVSAVAGINHPLKRSPQDASSNSESESQQS